MTYTPHTVWIPMVKPQATYLRPTRRLEIKPITTPQVAAYLEKHDELTATDISAVLESTTSTVYDILLRLERKGFVSRHRGKIPTCNAPRWLWKSVTPHQPAMTGRQQILNWLKVNPWSSSDQIAKATGLGSIVTTMSRIDKFGGKVKMEIRPNQYGRMIKHYSALGVAV